MRRSRRQRMLVGFMASLMLWLSSYASVCLAAGTAQAAGSASMDCSCPFAGSGGMAAGCARAEDLSTYAQAAHAAPAQPDFQPLAIVPASISVPPVRYIRVASTPDVSPPHPDRSLTDRFCVFLE